MNIAITGVTGLLGSNLFVELIRYLKNDLNNINLILFGRDKDMMSFSERIKNIIKIDYHEIFGMSQINNIIEFIDENVNYVYVDFDKSDLGLRYDDIGFLKSIEIDIFYHCAALTDFRSSPSVCEKLDQVNIEGTKAILKLTDSLKIGQFCYVGSAYSCGMKTGEILADYISEDRIFRNHYEYTKLMAELEVRKHSLTSKTRFRYFRTSTICGRLIDAPIGFVTKFDVFYAWAAFFLRLKMKRVDTLNDIYSIPYEIPIRICFNPQSGLNIVPADYIAKMMVLTAIEEHPETNFYLVNNTETPHSLYISLMLEAINVCGVDYLRNIPMNMTAMENFYYKTVGAIYTPYITSAPILFNNDNLKEFSKKWNVSCPSVNEMNFRKLMAFAKTKYFGLINESISDKKNGINSTTIASNERVSTSSTCSV